MNPIKPKWYKRPRIWKGIVLLVVGLLGLAGISVDEEQAGQIVNFVLGILAFL